MRLLFIMVCLWFSFYPSHAQADDPMYTNTISCKTMSNIFLLMHMWKYYGEQERAEALVYLVHTRQSCTLLRSLHPELHRSQPIATYEIEADDALLQVSLLMIPHEAGPEYVISSQAKQ